MVVEPIGGGGPDPEIVRSLAETLASQFQAPVDDPDTDLMAEGILDSLAFVELLAILESHFGVVVRVESLDFEDFRSLNTIARWVEANRPAR